MAQTDNSQPPAGVGGYTDAKPQFTGQPQPYGQTDPYAQQGAYGAQQAYGAAPTSPAPQYTNPGSPPPQQAYQSDVKYGYAGAPANGAAELGGETSGIAPASANASNIPPPQTAELGGDSTQLAPPQGQTAFHGAELADTNTSKPTTH